MLQKTVLNIVSNFLPDILKKYLQPEQVDQVMADVEKQRLQVFSSLLEK